MSERKTMFPTVLKKETFSNKTFLFKKMDNKTRE